MTISTVSLHSQTGDQSLVEGQVFSFTLSSGTFIDTAENPLTYSATSTDGTELPTWISFDPKSLTFTGTTPVGIAGTGIKVLATDSSGGISAEAFHLYPKQIYPVLVQQERDVSLHIQPNNDYTLVVPKNSFQDVKPGQTLTYTATQVDGTPLPSWMSFNPVSVTFNTTVPSWSVDQQVVVTATATDGSAAAEAFHIRNSPTAIQNTVTMSAGSAFSISLVSAAIPANASQVSVRTLDGSPVPDGITVTTQPYKGGFIENLSGTTPTGLQKLALLVDYKPTDITQASTTEFDVSVVPNGAAPLALVGQTADVRAAFNQPFNFSNGPVFGYGSGGDHYTFSGEGGKALPSWLIPDTVNNGTSGTTPNYAVSVGVVVTDTDSAGFTASEEFHIFSQATPPVLNGQTDDVRVNLGKTFSKYLGQGTLANSPTFSDPDRGTLSFTVTGQDGAALPSWLSYNASSSMLSGTAPTTATTQNVVVTATGSKGGVSAESFNVIGQPGNPTYTQYNDVRTNLGGYVSQYVRGNDFQDADGGYVNVQLAGPNGSALPSWLSYNQTVGLLYGNAPATQTTQSVVVTGTGSNGGVSTERFNIYDQPNAPVSSVQQDDVRFRGGSAVNVVLDPNAFTTASTNPVTLTALQQDGTALPTWLSFNAATATLSGNAPTTPATVGVEIIATDTYGRTAAEGFNFISSAPAAATSGSLISLTENGHFAYDLTSIFHDQVGSTAFSYSGTFTGSDPALASLAVSSTGSLTGNVPSTIPANSFWNLDVMAVGNQGSVGHQQINIYDGYAL